MADTRKQVLARQMLVAEGIKKAESNEKKPMYKAPGLPPVSMADEDIGVTLDDRIARDQKITDKTGVVVRPDAYRDPEQDYGMLQYNLNVAKNNPNDFGSDKKAAASAAKYYQDKIDSILKASGEQRQRLIQRYMK
jgi:hypothetical protein